MGKKASRPTKQVEDGFLFIDAVKNNRYHLFLLATVLLIYARTLTFGFVYHDDDTMILNNTAALQQFNFQKIFLTDAWFHEKAIELYRPWQSFTYYIDYQLWEVNPLGYHLHNLLVFAAAILCINIFLQQIGFSKVWAFALTWFYSAHYLFAHTVSWVPARGDLYLVLFGISSLTFFLRYVQNENAKHLLVASFLFFFALLAKETAIVLIPVVILFQWEAAGFTIANLRKIRLAWMLWLLIPVVVYLLMRHNSIAASPFVGLGSLIYNLPQIPELFIKFFVPVRFTVLPDFVTAYTIGGTVLIAVFAAAAFYFSKGGGAKFIVSGAVFSLLTILPSLAYKPNFSGFAYDYLDHRMFFVGIGLLVFLGGLLLRFSETIKSFNPIKVLAAPVLLFGVCSFMYQGAYTDYKSYYQSALKTNERSGLAILNYAILQRQKEKNYIGSIEMCNLGIAQYPDTFMFYKEKALDYYYLGKFDTMMQVAANLGRLPRGLHDMYVMQGIYQSSQKQPDSAIAAFSSAILIQPEAAEDYYNRAKMYREKGEMNAAMLDLNRAVQLAPSYKEAIYERGNIFGNMGYFREALSDFVLYTTLNPTDPNGVFYRGQAYVLTGNKAQGCADLKKAMDMGSKEATKKFAELCQ